MGLAADERSVDNSFDLTIDAAVTGAATLGYAQDADTTKRVWDVAGNALAGVSGVEVGGRVVLVDAVSGGYVNGIEDDSAVTISGTSIGVADGTAVTVSIDDSDADSTADVVLSSGVTVTSDAWSASLSSVQMQGLEEGTVSVTATS